MTNMPTGIVDNSAAMPYIYGAYGVMALLFFGLALFAYGKLKKSTREAERLNPRNLNKNKTNKKT